MGLKTVKMPIGMRISRYHPITAEPEGQRPTYGTALDMGAARTGTLTITTASVDIPGDDIVQVHMEQFVTGQLVAETDCDDLEINAVIFGHSYADGVEASSGDDTAPDGGYDFVEPILMKDKSIVYRATALLKLTAQQATEQQNAATRPVGSIEPKTKSITYTVQECATREWRLRQEFEDEATAIAWLDAIFGGTGLYKITISKVGTGSVTPTGTVYVEGGETQVIQFGATDPTELLDNGVDVTSQISDHTYTLSNVSAAHTITATFAS